MLLTLAQVAQRLTLSVRTVRRLIADGKLAVVRPQSGGVIVSDDALETYLKTCGWNPNAYVDTSKMTPHNKAIAELAATDPDMQTKHFRKYVRARLCSESDDDNYFPWDEVANVLRFVPDAFKVAGSELHCHEVVDTSRITQEKQDVYGRAFNALDFWGRTLRLWVHDLKGNNHEQNLEAWFVDMARRSQPMEGPDDRPMD